MLINTHRYIPLMTRINRIVVIFVLFLCPVVFSMAQSADILLPKGSVEGFLKNGFHYIIIPEKSPASRVEFRLVMRVGSLLETEKEKGCAHFLEHLAFGETEHFPKRSLVSYLESTGMKYGIDINAYTGFDRTVYTFAVPVDIDREQRLENSVGIVRDWLGGIIIDSLGVSSEKGIILEELRDYTPGDDFYYLKIGTGLYHRRMPLGLEEDINNASAEVLRSFYKKWYKPSAATLIVAGDVTLKEIEPVIKATIGTLAGKASAPIAFPSLDYKKDIIVAEAIDSLGNKAVIDLMLPYNGKVLNTMEDALEKEQAALLVRAVSSRLHSRGVKCDVSDKWYLSDKNHFSINITGKSRKEIMDNLSRIISELSSLKENGWDEREFEDIRMAFLSEYRRKAKNLPVTSAQWCEELIDYAVSGDKYISDDSQIEIIAEGLSNTDSRYLAKILGDRLNLDGTVLVGIRTYPGFGKRISKREISKALTKGINTKAAEFRYTGTRNDGKSYEYDVPECLSVLNGYCPENIHKRLEYKDIGVTEIVLKNGIKLIMKPLPAADSIVLLTSFAPSGLSEIPDNKYPFLEGTASYMDMWGIKGLVGDAFSEYLFRRGMSFTTIIDNDWHGFIGGTDSAHVTEFLNLVYNKIFNPELDYDDFEETRSACIGACREQSVLSRRLERSPERRLNARICEYMGDDLRGGNITEEQMKSLSLDEISGYYKELYSCTEGSVYVICGQFDVEEMLRSFVSVFGSIEYSSKVRYSGRESGKLFSGPASEYFYGGDGYNRTGLDCIFMGNYTPGLKNALELKLMRDIIRSRLITELREKESLVYSPYVSLVYSGRPDGKYYFDINVSSSTDNMPKVLESIKGIVRSLHSEEISADELAAIKKSFIIARRETLSDDNAGAWRNTIVDLLKNGESLSDFGRYAVILDSITSEDLKKRFEEYIDTSRMKTFYIVGN